MALDLQSAYDTVWRARLLESSLRWGWIGTSFAGCNQFWKVGWPASWWVRVQRRWPPLAESHRGRPFC